MGSVVSFLEAEKKTWSEHKIVFDSTVREANINLLDNFRDGDELYLGYQTNTFQGLTYQHWFVTDRLFFLEFGSPSVDIYTARVLINTAPRVNYTANAFKKMDSEIRDRMRHVIGMSNYSLCLRNCEHVANYVFRGRWISFQMDEMGCLMCSFRKNLLGNTYRLVNTFPSTIRPHIFHEGKGKTMYSFIKEHYTAKRFDYYLDHNENTYNILVLGPTGAGKSHLINVFFNQPICDADVSHRSVTREMCFVRGNGLIYNVLTNQHEEREIVVADTVGICDTEWDDQKIINMIKGRVSSNFKYVDAVFFVFRADRLLKEHVQNIKILMNWLGYYKGANSLKFLFVGTYAENLTEEKKDQLRMEATEILQLRNTARTLVHSGEDIESLVYTGFPPEDCLNDKTKIRVVNSWELLQPLLLNPGISRQLASDARFQEVAKARLSTGDMYACNIL